MSKIEMHISRDEEGNAIYGHDWQGVDWSDVLSILDIFLDKSLSALSNETRIPRTLLLAMLTEGVENDWKEGAQDGQ